MILWGGVNLGQIPEHTYMHTYFFKDQLHNVEFSPLTQ